jgi:activator of HSP90 ATPase
MKTYKKYAELSASPEEVYLAMVKPQAIRLWSGADAEMSEEPGSAFSWFDGDITGTVTDAEHGRKLVMKWDFGEEQSEVVLKFHQKGEGTSMEIRQDGIPDEAYENMQEGWEELIIPSLSEYFSG